MGNKLILQADGGSRGNPGPAAIGVVIQESGGQTLYEKGLSIGPATNNQAEYHALIHGLEALQQFHPSAVEIVLDSQLVVEQMNGRYKVKNAGLGPLVARAQTLVNELSVPVTFRHVLRRHNTHADRLVNAALDEKTN